MYVPAVTNPQSGRTCVPSRVRDRPTLATDPLARPPVTASDATATKGELLLFANDADHAELTATEPSHVIILSGQPLEEPVVAYGPFVMNTFDEIRQAFVDVQDGKFGDVPEE